LTGFPHLITFVRMRLSGLLDLQVNGYAGIDFNDAAINPAKIDHALAAMRDAGISHCLPTLITAQQEILSHRLLALDRAVGASRLGASMVPGYHLEGPFLSAEDGYSGCHPTASMCDPDIKFVQELEAPLAHPILLITLAPERPNAVPFIRWARQAGKVVALGHSGANAHEIAQAVEAGATVSTHLGNAMRQMQPKFDNPLMWQLAEDRLWATFIADGIHVPPHALKIMLRAKGPARSILVTDAASAAATKAGQYSFGGMPIERDAAGAVRVPGTDRLAGSSLTLDQAVRNIVGWDLASEEQAVQMARDNPRALLAPALAAHGVRLTEPA
jgi:N-acetylglucosamine-6-phosphate deacetylase